MQFVFFCHRVPNIPGQEFYFLGLGVSICLDVVWIETLDLDISKSWSQPSRKSRRFSKVSLDEVSIGLDDFYAIKSWFVLIFIFVSIETLDLDAKKKSVSTVEKISTVFKS